ncbi:hypothetical protein [Micromonospora cathayae]|uniref:Uncharacterized protein n=1 Tax=Micromonospora cathayae TaxID=3028804 RepID=A0ABY7ZWR0_9ACTN|nr:hypothetical protein [Micromonospora sp. HUAS 3]WDZ87467.1 hypothetical protein PVK37_14180 [Micromonospora sp. HUAS 3]
MVWAQRLCPTRARVLNVPTPESGRRFGEIVVHDGAPNGEREVDGHAYPVFDELLLLRASPLPTTVVDVTAARTADVHALVELFTERGYGAEPASGTRLLCACCSAGNVQQDRDHQTAGTQQVHLAAPPDELPELVERWRAADPDHRSWSPPA